MIRLLKSIIMTVLVLLLTLAVSWGVATKRIAKVEVTGAPDHREKDIVELLKPFLDRSIVFFPVNEVSNRLYSKLPLGSAVVSVQWPDILKVQLQFRDAELWMVADQGVFGIDREGYRLDEVVLEQKTVIPTIVEGCTVHEESRSTACTRMAVALYHQLIMNNVPADRVGGIFIKGRQMSIRMHGGLEVRLGDDSHLAEKLERLNECLKWFAKNKIGVKRLDLFNPAQPIARLTDRTVS